MKKLLPILLTILLLPSNVFSARLFDDASSEYYYSTNVISVYPYTMVGWFNTDNNTAFQSVVFTAKSDAVQHRVGVGLRGEVGGDPVGVYTQDLGANEWILTTTGFSADTWHHAAGVWVSSTERYAFIDGGSKGSSTGTDVTPVGVDNTAIGGLRDSTPGNTMSGLIAEAAVWDIALSDAEIASLAAGFSPLLVRPQNLVAYWPLIRGIDDIVGRNSLTIVGTPTVSNHPPVIFASSPHIITSPPAEAAEGAKPVPPKLILSKPKTAKERIVWVK